MEISDLKNEVQTLIEKNEADADLYLDWIYRNFQIAPKKPEERVKVNEEMTAHLDALLRDRLDNPQDDMLTMIANAEIDGEEVAWDLKTGYVALLIIEQPRKIRWRMQRLELHEFDAWVGHNHR